LCESYWTKELDAFTQNWFQDGPVWMNPPFRLFPEILDRLRRTGGHILLLCPAWSTCFQNFRQMARGACKLPLGRLFLREGWDLMPEPRWDAWVFLIHYIRPTAVSLLGRQALPSPRARASRRVYPLWALLRGHTMIDVYDPENAGGRVQALLTCGDVESNPGPEQGPASATTLNWHEALRACNAFTIEAVDTTWPGRSGPDTGRLGLSGPFVTAVCGVCGESLRFRETWQMWRHLDACIPQCAEPDPPATGRGDMILTCGDVEENPGPKPPPEHENERHLRHGGGRGDALPTCGDVEQNPGPEQAGGPPYRVPEDPCEALWNAISRAGGPMAATGQAGDDTMNALMGQLLEHMGTMPANSPAPGPPRRQPGPERPSARRRQPLDEMNLDPVHGPAPPGPPGAVLAEEVDLAHAEHPGPAVHPTDASGNELRVATRAAEQGPLVLPHPLPLQEVLACRLQPIHHLPAALQSDFSGALTAALRRYCSAPTDGNLFALLAFPKLTLRSPVVRGRFSHDHLVTGIRQRLALFTKGDIKALWDELQEEIKRGQNAGGVETRGAKRTRQAEGAISSTTMRRVRRLIGEGASRKALDMLTSHGTHDPSDPGVLAVLRTLHPRAAPPTMDGLPHNLDPLLGDGDEEGFWEHLVRDAVLRFPRASAAGPSGLRPSHLQDALKRRGGGLALIGALAAICKKWCRGGLPRNTARGYVGPT
jgi:hypothetical protein